MDTDVMKSMRNIITRMHAKYDFDDKDITPTITELINKGVPNGCFQDYTVVGVIVEILGLMERVTKTLE